MTDKRRFPMLGGGGSVPWSWGEQFFALYDAVHPCNYKAAEEIAARGGIGWSEVHDMLQRYRKKFGKEWEFTDNEMD